MRNRGSVCWRPTIKPRGQCCTSWTPINQPAAARDGTISKELRALTSVDPASTLVRRLRPITAFDVSSARSVGGARVNQVSFRTGDCGLSSRIEFLQSFQRSRISSDRTNASRADCRCALRPACSAGSSKSLASCRFLTRRTVE